MSLILLLIIVLLVLGVIWPGTVMNRSSMSVWLVSFCMMLAACGSETRVVQTNDTCGKQMTDLQAALDSGAMTRSEYDKARRVAIERCDTRDTH
jgi:hypothetical protein